MPVERRCSPFGHTPAQVVQVDKGAVIADVSPQGPGARAGLRDDDVITQVGSTAIASAGGLTRAVGQLEPDSRVTVHVQRGEPPVPSREEDSAPTKGRLGMRLADDPEGQGARLVAVEPGSPADRAELPPGALLRQVGDHKVASAHDAAEALRSAKPGSMLLLRIQPQGSDVTPLRALPVPS